MTESALADVLPACPIPALSNNLLVRLIEAGQIAISNFDPRKLAPTSYQITPGLVRYHVEDEDGFPLAGGVRNLAHGGQQAVRPGEYVVVSPQEVIELAPGFTVDFFPSSWCVENRLVVTAGRLDHSYKGDLVFGVFNAGRYDVTLTSTFQLLRASFSWLGKENLPAYDEALPPGSYIPNISKLREREAEVAEMEDELRRRREELAKMRERFCSAQ